MAGGYTPARAAPVTNRSAMAVAAVGATITAAVAAAASTLEPATSLRADQRSGSVRVAESSAPRTNPSCTDTVSHALVWGVSPQRAASAGATADALNHGASASSWL